MSLRIRADAVLSSIASFQDGEWLVECDDAGCALRCAFCATGAMGFSRNLTAFEIAGQVREMLNFFSGKCHFRGL